MTAIPIVDVFAGPGGLNEGFSSLLDAHGRPVFRTANSFEVDDEAVNTLRLRAALRRIRLATGTIPRVYYDLLRGRRNTTQLEASSEFAAAFKDAEREVQKLRLGAQTRAESDAQIRESLKGSGDGPWALVGGPPCQAYSLAGRSRRVNDPDFVSDEKHVLYREYLHILQEHRPTVFVMENVKGMLSSQHDGGLVFQKILDDLRSPAGGLEYEIRSFLLEGSDPEPKDFVLRSEDFGVPQRRHRVILLGVNRAMGLGEHERLRSTSNVVTVADAIGDLPAIRSMISPRSRDSEATFLDSRTRGQLLARYPVSTRRLPLGAPFVSSASVKGPDSLRAWLCDDSIGGVVHHESRAHMASDLVRYAYLAAKASENLFPKVNELRGDLAPAHTNASREDAPFADRFRVQRADRPSTTVVSHIAKDGHYYIHPDPDQVRSLSVREAARLQTFPDNYYFAGSRTDQYRQVGNAVPPWLARQLGASVAKLLGVEVVAERI